MSELASNPVGYGLPVDYVGTYLVGHPHTEIINVVILSSLNKKAI